ncbi:MAG: TolC family protein [Rhodothermales bacterium]|nr:TolC family protein [Rhodothermales bacterium]
MKRKRLSELDRRHATGYVARLVLAGFLLVAPTDEAASQADTLRYNLDSAIRRALEASPEVSAVAARRDFASARAGLARASRYLTEFTLTSAHAPAPGLDNPNGTATDQLFLDPDVRNDWGSLRPFNEVEVEFLQPLYTWGELDGNIRAATSAVVMEDASIRDKEIDVAYRTAELYYGLLLTEALTVVVKDAGDIVEQAKEEIDRLLQEGAADVDDADLFQVLITEQEFKRRVVEVDEKRRTAATALRRQLFLPDDVTVAVDEVILSQIRLEPETLEWYQELAMLHRPELERANAGLAARRALVDVARSNYYPKIFLGGRFRAAGTSGRYSQPNPYHGDRLRGTSVEAGLGVRLGLSFHQTRARVEQARAQANEVGFQLDGLRQLILFEVEEAFRGLSIADAALTSTHEAYRLSKEWLQMETVNFDLDLGDTENLVKAVRANLDLQADRYQATYRYNLAALKLLRSCGMLRQTIDSGILVE